ncbi:MAG: tetratricopeptide repeat protein [bacterium]|nr:tetratricopeptide repeat protein [bacterium]
MPEAFNVERERRILGWFETSRTKDPTERECFLADLRARDPGACSRVERLLASYEDGRSLPELNIEEAVRAASELASPPSPLPGHIGAYTITRHIGSGGMGEVYEAEQEDPKRLVALKVMSQGLQTESALQRFRYEAQVLGQLDHPGIARIYEAGVHVERWGLAERHIPFFAMEYVAGARSLNEYAKQERLDVRARVRLVVSACRAVAAGHRQLIIHRDLKPSNLLVAPDGAIKVIDFGVARRLGQPAEARGVETAPGFVIGTPMYMSPEQFSDEMGPIDVRSDVYSLGVVAFELLAEQHPLQSIRERPVSEWPLAEVARAVLEGRNARLIDIAPGTNPELGWIVGKALKLEANDRYGGASELADDFERFLGNQAVVAGQPSSLYRLRKFVRRNRLPVAASVMALTLALAGGGWFVVMRVEHNLIVQDRRDEQLARLFEDVFASEMIETGWQTRGDEILNFAGLVREGATPDSGASALARHSLRLLELRLATFRSYGIPLDRSLSSGEIVDRVDATYERSPAAGRALWSELGSLLFSMRAWGFMGALAVADESPPEWASKEQIARWTRIIAEQPEGVEFTRLLQNCLPHEANRQLGKAWTCLFRNYSTSDPWLDEIEAEMSDSAACLTWMGAIKTMIAGEESAGRYFQAAIDKDPAALIARFCLGHYYEQSSFAGFDPAQAIVHYTACVARVPNWVGAWNGLAASYGLIENVDEAQRCAQRALDINPETAPAWNNLGWVHLRRGAYERAVECFGRALAIQPQDSKARANRGIALGRLGRYEEGLADFDHVESHDPEHVKVHRYRGELLLVAKLFEEALEAYDRALELEGESASVLANTGACLAKLGREDEEETRYRRALEIDPDNLNANKNLGILLHSQRQWEAAIPFYERALAVDSSEKRCRVNLGYIQLELEAWTEAERHFQFLSELEPDSARWPLNVGRARHGAGDHAGAIDAFDASSALDPTSVWPRFERALERLAKGEHSEGLDDLEGTIEMVRSAVEGGEPTAANRCKHARTTLATLQEGSWQLGAGERARLNALQETMAALLRKQSERK